MTPLPANTDATTSADATPTLAEHDVSGRVGRRDTGNHRIDQDALASAVAELVAARPGGGGVSKKTWTTIVGAVLALVTAVGAGNWTVMSSGDADTQAIVREELRTYGDKMQDKVKGERDALRLEIKSEREADRKEIADIKTSIQKISVDIAVIRAKAEK
jgi:hypothetical protein